MLYDGTCFLALYGFSYYLSISFLKEKAKLYISNQANSYGWFYYNIIFANFQ